MLPAIIDHPTLTKWKNHRPGTLHGEILAGLSGLIEMALRYDDAVVISRARKQKIKDLEAEIEVLKLECAELKLAGCRAWDCAGRRG